MTNHLLAIDPGLMTGVVLIDTSNWDDPVPMWSVELTIEEFYVKLEEVFEQYQGDLEVAIENFIVTEETGKLTQQPWSQYLIGIVMYFCWKYDLTEPKKQAPVEKNFADNDKLRKVNFWHVGGAGHANDAYRHAMIYIVNKHRSWARKLV